jgi:hypothetical protein
MATLFRVQKHSSPDHLSDHVDLVRIWKHGRAFFRGRMRLDQELAALQSAPPANKAFAVFQEINRPVKLVAPPSTGNLASALIDQHQRTGPQDGKHRPVFQTHDSVAVLLGIGAGNQPQRQFAPTSGQLAQEGSLVEVDLSIER